MPPLAAITPADLCVVLGLTLLAIVLWALRGGVRLVLALLPFVMAVLAPVAAWGLYSLGEHMNWDSPGSPAILVVVFALGVAVLMSIGAWVALVLQITRWRNRPSSDAATVRADGTRVASAIMITTGLLFFAYLDYRSHRPSHEATVRQMYFSPDGESLYSLDESGVLKRWNVHDAYQAARWSLPGVRDASHIGLSSDGRALLVVARGELSVWNLAEAPRSESGGHMTGVVSVEPLAGSGIAVVTSDELSIRAYTDLQTPKASIKLTATALSLCAYPDNRMVVGTEAPALEIYRVQATGTSSIVRNSEVPLAFAPRVIRADRSGRYLVVSEPGVNMIVLDAQGLTQDPLPDHLAVALFEVSAEDQLLLAGGERSARLRSRAEIHAAPLQPWRDDRCARRVAGVATCSPSRTGTTSSSTATAGRMQGRDVAEWQGRDSRRAASALTRARAGCDYFGSVTLNGIAASCSGALPSLCSNGSQRASLFKFANRG
jgi:hypothetical protein